MATRPRAAARARRDGSVEQQPGDHDALGQAMDPAVRSEAKRRKRQRTARELAEALPDVIGVLDFVQNVWPQ